MAELEDKVAVVFTEAATLDITGPSGLQEGRWPFREQVRACLVS